MALKLVNDSFGSIGGFQINSPRGELREPVRVSMEASINWYRTFGLAEDGVGYAENDYNRDMIADIEPRLDELKQRIIAGEIKVPESRTGLSTFLQSLPK